MVEILEKTSEVDSAPSIEEKVNAYTVPTVPYENSEPVDSIDKELENSLNDMDNKETNTSTLEAVNGSPESVVLEASKIWNDLKKAFDQAAIKLWTALESFSFYLDDKNVSVSIHDRFDLVDWWSSSRYTDYNNYVPEKILEISVKDLKNPNAIPKTCEIGFWKENRASAFKKEHDWVSVEVYSDKTVYVNEFCRNDEEFKSATTRANANNFLWLAKRVSLQTTNIINTLYKKQQEK